MPANPIRILFVCTGNICRSPTAEGIFRRLVDEAGLGDRFAIESAGTHDYHAGAAPDPRACRVAARYGIDLSAQRARKVSAGDFERFDYIIALDQGHKRFLAERFVEGAAAEIRLLMEFGSEDRPLDVPDPYDGNEADFERAFGLIENAACGLLAALRAKHE